jgi:rubrerythrin
MAYSLKEIVDIAVGLEDAGREFYEECGRFFKDAGMKDTFEFLAREEQVHKELFQAFQWREGSFDRGNFNDEYFAYLRAVGGGQVFDRHMVNMRDLVHGMTTPLDAIKRAFIAEKDSILLYAEMMRLYPGHHAAADMLERIIAEERKHILTLYDLTEKIKQT